MRKNDDCFKVWRKDHFTLRLWYAERERGWLFDRVILAYQFKDGHKIIFEGEDFSPSPLHAYDSLESVYALLGFLSLQEGDTDYEYFKDYTPEQLAWTESSRCDDLQYLVMIFEEKRIK